ncbi:MAG: TIGR04282 family arsenosugar biosynthesis glycosyltransferase [Paracoccaceae bacterium]
MVVFVKEPRPGRVKTRLARMVGPVGAAWWYRHQAGALIRRLGGDPRWRLALAVSPDAEGMASRVWPRGIARLPQGGGDLGRRMTRALARARTLTPGPVAVVGSDVPGLDGRALARALDALKGADAALGPAPDGGFWFLGLAPGRCLAPDALDGARWSSPHALADTRARLAPRRVALGPMLADVDEAADLRALGLAVPTRGPR